MFSASVWAAVVAVVGALSGALTAAYNFGKRAGGAKETTLTAQVKELERQLESKTNEAKRLRQQRDDAAAIDSVAAARRSLHGKKNS